MVRTIAGKGSKNEGEHVHHLESQLRSGTRAVRLSEQIRGGAGKRDWTPQVLARTSYTETYAVLRRTNVVHRGQNVHPPHPTHLCGAGDCCGYTIQ